MQCFSPTPSQTTWSSVVFFPSYTIFLHKGTHLNKCTLFILLYIVKKVQIIIYFNCYSFLILHHSLGSLYILSFLKVYICTGFLVMLHVSNSHSEVITSAVFHPVYCNLLAYGSSRGFIRVVDMRQSALCDRSAKMWAYINLIISRVVIVLCFLFLCLMQYRQLLLKVLQRI